MYRTESSQTSTNELKRMKYLIYGMHDNMAESAAANVEKLEMMESTIADLQLQLEQMDARFDQSRKEMKDVSVIGDSSVVLLFMLSTQVTTALNWMMVAMAKGKMAESEPPLIQESSSELKI